MKRKSGILVFITLIIHSMYSQNDLITHKDSIPLAIKQYDALFNQLINEKNQQRISRPDYRLGVNYNSIKYITLRRDNFYKQQADLTFLTLQNNQATPNKFLIPLKQSSEYNQSLHSSFSFIYDYNNYYRLYNLSDKLTLSSANNRISYIGIGSQQIVNPRLTYSPVSWLQLSGGIYGAKNNFSGISFNNFGYNGAVKLIPIDAIRINIYGQYSASGRDKLKNMQNKGCVNAGSPMMYLYPQTSFGGSLEFKINDKFGAEVGIMRELNPFNGKWVNTPFVAPLIYSK